MNYCTNCGRPLIIDVPAGDDRQRYICPDCTMIHYQNPKMVVGCIPVHQERVLLCRRSIEPGYGKWTIPAGYLENHETVTEGARREAWEEAGIVLEDMIPYRLFNIVHIAQIYLIFRGTIVDGGFHPGDESLDAGLFSESEIPWQEIAFRVVSVSLENYFKDRQSGIFPFKTDDIRPRR